MAAPVALRSQYGHFFGASMLPALEEVFRAEIARHPSRRDQLFKTVTIDRDIWQSSETHDMDLFNEVSEGSEYSFKRNKQGAAKTLEVSKYGLGFSISEEAVDDGKFDLIADMTKRLARSGKESQEINAAAIFNNGFSSVKTADGLSLFNTAHTLPSGLTFRNKLSVDADLDATSLEQMLLDFETQFIGDSGIIYNMKAVALWCHPSNKRYAMELLGSELKADTADNNMNSFKNEGLSVISWPHLSDPDAWGLITRPEDTGLRIVSRKPIETKAAGPDVGFATDSIYYKSRYRETIGATHPYGIFASAGA